MFEAASAFWAGLREAKTFSEAAVGAAILETRPQ